MNNISYTQHKRPGPVSGLRHIALFCENLLASVRFYTEIIGMQIEWQPDANNYYLTSGNDNLALHQAHSNLAPSKNKAQYLDHLGFILDKLDLVDSWYEFMVSQNIKIAAKPKTHRDGARSFYCKDPDDRLVQMIYHPPISNK